MGLGAIAVACARAAQEGKTIDEVEALAHDLSRRCKVWGALDTLENLKKGGRIGGAKAMLASVLSIKPIIEVRDGVVQEGGKQRTRSKALAFLVDKVREASANPGISQLAVLNADCSDVDAFVAQLKTVYSGEIMVGEIGAVVGAHAGRGTIGVAFFEN
jgi:DegV family protein with EDD domain